MPLFEKKTTYVLATGAAIMLSGMSAQAADTFSAIDTEEPYGTITLEEFQEYFGDRLGQVAYDKYNTDGTDGVTMKEVEGVASEEGWENSSAGMKTAYEKSSAGRATAEANRQAAQARDDDGDRGGPPEDRGGPPDGRGPSTD